MNESRWKSYFWRTTCVPLWCSWTGPNRVFSMLLFASFLIFDTGNEYGGEVWPIIIGPRCLQKPSSTSKRWSVDLKSPSVKHSKVSSLARLLRLGKDGWLHGRQWHNFKLDFVLFRFLCTGTSARREFTQPHFAVVWIARACFTFVLPLFP